MFAKANPNEYLVVGRGGRVTNRGTGTRVILWPGSTYVLIPSTKQEAAFEMTQETKDGIPLHFKGIVIYRITHPEQIAVNFNFHDGGGVAEINAFIRNICLGELRAAAAGMTMQECIEQRKTVLTSTVAAALRQVILTDQDDVLKQWGIDVEMVQVAQVYIIDNELRRNLEAEIRNQIRLRGDQSGLRAQEEIRLTQLASDRHVQEQGLADDKDAVRRKEELDLTKLQYDRRMQVERQELERERLQLEIQKYQFEQDAQRQKAEIETPVRLLQLEKQRAILESELAVLQVENRVRELVVRRDLVLENARQELRRAILPLEQTPVLAESLSHLLNGAHLTLFGSDNQVLGSLLPVVDLFAKMVGNNLAEPGQAPKAGEAEK
jgi:hypothetical protein